MLNFISRARVFSDAKTHRLQLSSTDKSRSKIDLLYRFIAQLNLPDFEVEKVDVWESSLNGDITFREVPRGEIGGSKIAHLIKRRWVKSGLCFKVNLSVVQLDRLGWNFHVDYCFDDRLQGVTGPQKKRLDTQIHTMMETAFVGHPNILVSPVLNFET